MKIALAMITQGDKELEFLKGAVASALPAVDSVYITANQTPYSATKEWCEKNGYHFSFLKWNKDFGEQRNFNFSQVPKDYDFILWMDSDDVIIGAEYLKEIAAISKKQEFDVVFFDYWYGAKFKGKPSLETFVEQELTQKRERLIRMGKTTWKKRIHETPVPIDGEHFRYSRVPYTPEKPVAWLHLGADREMDIKAIEAKMARNRELLELELNDERKDGEADPRTLLYLMKIYAESEDPQILKKCVELGDEYLQKSGWDQERAVCYQMMSKCMGKLGLNEDAKDFLHNAIKEYPYDPLLYLYLARTYFNLGDFRAMHHWMTLGLNLKMEDNNSGFQNILELKIVSSELMVEYYFNGEKNVDKAYEAAVMLNKVNPTPQNQQNVDYLLNAKKLNSAAKNVHEVILHLEETNQEDKIADLVKTLPDELKHLPFAINYYNKYQEPRVWGDNEICYYANFGGPWFEKWDGNSVKTGLGGSETAIVKLSEEWAKLGYKVTVYGDPNTVGEINGVTYLPFYEFNQRDLFNIFVQWRNNHMADKVNAKKFYVDLHDIYFEATLKPKLLQTDKIFVKSKYHRDLAPEIPDNKFEVIPNGL